MKFSRRSTILGGAALAAGSAAPARAQLTIDMTKPSFEPVPIAIVDFSGDRVGADIAGVIRNDLQNSGLFRSISPSSFIQRDVDANAAPRFADWRGVGAAGLVVGQIQQSGGNIKVDFRLWDVVVGQQATGLSFNSQPSNWRRLAHIIADAIYKRVTGEEGYFDTRVAYVSETGPLASRVKRIAIMDQDGANNRYITDGRTLAITPRFAPTLQEIVYMAYGEDRSPPKVYLQSAGYFVDIPAEFASFQTHVLRTVSNMKSIQDKYRQRLMLIQTDANPLFALPDFKWELFYSDKIDAPYKTAARALVVSGRGPYHPGPHIRIPLSVTATKRVLFELAKTIYFANATLRHSDQVPFDIVTRLKESAELATGQKIDSS